MNHRILTLALCVLTVPAWTAAPKTVSAKMRQATKRRDWNQAKKHWREAMNNRPSVKPKKKRQANTIIDPADLNERKRLFQLADRCVTEMGLDPEGCYREVEETKRLFIVFYVVKPTNKNKLSINHGPVIIIKKYAEVVVATYMGP